MKPTFALIGLPTDRHSSYLRGPAKGPAFIRAALQCDANTIAAEDGLEVGQDLLINDCGDAPLHEADGDDEIIERTIAAAVKEGYCPISLGGDHAVTYPVVKAIHAQRGQVDILHFDAHPDLYDDYQGNKRSHASPFARIMEEGLARRLVQVGIRTLERRQRAQVERFGVEIIPMKTFSAYSVPILEGPLYVSIDLDGLDPSVAPGVSHHEPGGLTVRELLSVLHAQRAQLVGADVVELNPDRDINGMTATVAAKLVRELCAYACSRM
ncbi:MAG TPA: agmatinase [Steroidobacteraceae bacterium]|nr:agmatinase [Steroidobacteraceae bacterium]